MSGYFDGYATLALLVLAAALFLVAAMVANRALRPHRLTPLKRATYESGVEPVGTDWAQTQVRYYVYAFLYVVFAVDAVFLFPWATVFSATGFGGVSLGEMMVFLAFLAVGILYAWRRKVLEWL